MGSLGGAVWRWRGCGGGGGRRLCGPPLRWTSLRPCSDNFQQLWLEGAPGSVHRQWLDIPVMCAETRTHSANCAVLRRDSSGAALGPVLDMPVIVQRQVRSLRVKVVDISVRKPLRFSSCSSLTRCSMSVVQQSVRRQSRSHSCSQLSMDTVVACPLCATTDAGCQSAENCDGPAVAVLWQSGRCPRWCSSSTVLSSLWSCSDGCDSGSAPDSFHRRSQWTFQFATETGTQLLAVVVVATMQWFFGLFMSFFALLRVVPELSTSFRSPDGEEFFAIVGSCTISFSALVDMDILPERSNKNNNNHINNQQQQQPAEVPFLTGEEPPPLSGELNHALSQGGGPTQSQLSRPVSSRHHISVEHRLLRKHILLNRSTNAWSGINEEKKRNTFFKKNQKIGKWKKKKWKKQEQRRKKKEKRPQRGTSRGLKKKRFLFKKWYQKSWSKWGQKKNQYFSTLEKKTTNEPKENKTRKKEKKGSERGLETAEKWFFDQKCYQNSWRYRGQKKSNFEHHPRKEKEKEKEREKKTKTKTKKEKEKEKEFNNMKTKIGKKKTTKDDFLSRSMMNQSKQHHHEGALLEGRPVRILGGTSTEGFGEWVCYFDNQWVGGPVHRVQAQRCMPNNVWSGLKHVGTREYVDQLRPSVASATREEHSHWELVMLAVRSLFRWTELYSARQIALVMCCTHSVSF